jgi:hypothetical protein
MKKYMYILDPKGRITYIAETELETIETENHYIGDFEPSDVQKVSLGITGVKDNKFIYIGLSKEEVDTQEIYNKQSLIEGYKIMLQETDWKVVVNAELIQAGLPPKYPNLHEERQAWRDEINKLES